VPLNPCLWQDIIEEMNISSHKTTWTLPSSTKVVTSACLQVSSHSCKITQANQTKKRNVQFLTFSATVTHLLLNFSLCKCCFWVLGKQYFVAWQKLSGLWRVWLRVSKTKYKILFYKQRDHKMICSFCLSIVPDDCHQTEKDLSHLTNPCRWYNQPITNRQITQGTNQRSK